jgi:hypothetical protein
MFHSYTGSENQKYIPHRKPLNKCSKFLLLSLKNFVAEKRHVAMQKLFIEKVLKKNTQVSERLEQWVL